MQAFEQLEPFGPLADDQRIGQVCALIANVNRDTKKRSRPFTAADFMPSLAQLRDAAATQVRPMTKEERSRALDRMLFGVSSPRKKR